MDGAGMGCGGCEGRRLPPTPLTLARRPVRYLAHVLARLGAWLSVLSGGMRAELSQPAMDRRILHRLSVMTEDELRRIGLTASDVRAARAQEVGPVADFLAARRRARSGVKEW